jgi:hypothetical protein
VDVAVSNDSLGTLQACWPSAFAVGANTFGVILEREPMSTYGMV